MLTSCSSFQTLFGDPVMQRVRAMWREVVVNGEVRRFLALCPVTNIGGKTPEFHHPEPDVEDEEEIMCLSWKQILRLLTRSDLLIRYSAGLYQLKAAMNDHPTAHKCWPCANRNEIS